MSLRFGVIRLKIVPCMALRQRITQTRVMVMHAAAAEQTDQQLWEAIESVALVARRSPRISGCRRSRRRLEIDGHPRRQKEPVGATLNCGSIKMPGMLNVQHDGRQILATLLPFTGTPSGRGRPVETCGHPRI
jgi:hypothetical protein